MLYALAALYLLGVLACWTHCASCARRDGTWKGGARVAATSLGWALLWPVTAVFVALGAVVRLLHR